MNFPSRPLPRALENTSPSLSLLQSVFPMPRSKPHASWRPRTRGQRFHASMAAQHNRVTTGESLPSSASRRPGEVATSGTDWIAVSGEEIEMLMAPGQIGLSWQLSPRALGRYLSDPDASLHIRKHAASVLAISTLTRAFSSPGSAADRSLDVSGDLAAARPRARRTDR